MRGVLLWLCAAGPGPDPARVSAALERGLAKQAKRAQEWRAKTEENANSRAKDVCAA